MNEATTSGTIKKRYTGIIEEGFMVYKSSFQLPYSPYTLYLKIFETGFIYFRLSDDKDTPWIWWEGSKHNYHILKRDMVPFISKWEQEHAEKLVEQFIALTYQASLVHFKLFRSQAPYEN